jgi:hypothetical protein
LNSPAAESVDLYDDRGIAAGLYAGRDERIMENRALRLDAQMDRLGLLLFEPVNSHLDLGLVGGVVALDISDQPSTEGMKLTGNYLGVAVSGAALRIRRWRLDYELRVTYHSMEDRINDRRAEVDWLESSAGLNVKVAVSEDVSLYGGSYYAVSDIDQRLRGPVNETTGFDARGTTAVVGVALEVDPGGFVDLGVHQGEDDGFVLTFSRRY